MFGALRSRLSRALIRTAWLIDPPGVNNRIIKGLPDISAALVELFGVSDRTSADLNHHVAHQAPGMTRR